MGITVLVLWEKLSTNISSDIISCFIISMELNVPHSEMPKKHKLSYTISDKKDYRNVKMLNQKVFPYFSCKLFRHII